jgi:hypothetical protein
VSPYYAAPPGQPGGLARRGLLVAGLATLVLVLAAIFSAVWLLTRADGGGSGDGGTSDQPAPGPTAPMPTPCSTAPGSWLCTEPAPGPAAPTPQWTVAQWRPAAGPTPDRPAGRDPERRPEYPTSTAASYRGTDDGRPVTVYRVGRLGAPTSTPG